MDKSELQAIVVAHLRSMRAALYLNDLVVHVEYRKLSENVAGECRPLASYREATIALDPDEIKDERAALFVLQHELLHIVLSDIDIAFKACEPYCPSDPVQTSLEVTKQHAIDRAIGNVERILSFSGVSPRRLSATGSRFLGKVHGRKPRARKRRR
jgi:hypothetical protein